MNEGNIVQADTPEKIVLKPVNSFVKDFFKGESILTVLSRKPARDYIEPGSVDGEYIDEGSTLRDALTHMLTSGKDKVFINGGSISFKKNLSVAGSEAYEME